jgi:hypothetical protein
MLDLLENCLTEVHIAEIVVFSGCRDSSLDSQYILSTGEVLNAHVTILNPGGVWGRVFGCTNYEPIPQKTTRNQVEIQLLLYKDGGVFSGLFPSQIVKRLSVDFKIWYA